MQVPVGVGLQQVDTGPAGASVPAVRRRSTLVRWELALIPAVGWLLVFYLYPVAGTVVQSFTSFIPPERGGLDNYRWFFDNPTNVAILLRTMATALMVTVVCVILGFPYAYLMTVTTRRMNGLLLAGVTLPLWTSLLVRSFAWIAILQPSGPLSDSLRALGFDDVRILGTTAAVVIGMTQILIPYFILPLFAVLRTIDRGLLDAAASLGARPTKAFVRIYLPLATPGIFAGALLVYVLALGFFVTPALLGSPQNSMLSQLIVTQTSNLLAFGRAGAASTVLLVITVVLVAIAGRIAFRASGGTGGRRAE